MNRIVVVGAGISGLALAYRLEQLFPQADVTVLERNPRPGGTAWTERVDGFQVEIGPNGFLDSKESTMSLCRELGLEGQLKPASEAAGRNRYLFLDGHLRALPYSFASLLSNDLLSWRGKLAVLSERFRPRRREQGDESIAAFVRRRAGREAETLADALVTGIHAGDPALLSVQAAFPRLAALEKEYGSVLKGFGRTASLRRAEARKRGQSYPQKGRMWSFRPGMRLLIETLRDRLGKTPLLGVEVKKIERQQNLWLVQAEGKDCWPADAVVLTSPAYQQAAVLADLDADLAERIGSIAYNRVVVVALGYRRADVPMSLDGFGYIAPQRTRRDVLGVQWCSSIFPERAPEGMVLLRAMGGGWHRPEIAGWPDEQLLQAVRAELRLAMGIAAAPVFHHVVRWDRAIPQYFLGHLDRVGWIEERLKRHRGLFVGGNAYHGVALNDCTERAEIMAVQIQNYLKSLAFRTRLAPSEPET